METIHIRIEKDQKEKMAAVARFSGLSLTSWVRSTLIAAAQESDYSDAAEKLVRNEKLKKETAIPAIGETEF